MKSYKFIHMRFGFAHKMSNLFEQICEDFKDVTCRF